MFKHLTIGLLLLAIVIDPLLILFALRLLGIDVPYTLTTWTGALLLGLLVRGGSDRWWSATK